MFGADIECVGGRSGKCRKKFHYECGMKKGAIVNLQLKNYTFCHEHAINVCQYKTADEKVEIKKEPSETPQQKGGHIIDLENSFEINQKIFEAVDLTASVSLHDHTYALPPA